MYKDGYFYAAYGGGKILRFGFNLGDEVYLGDTGYAQIGDLAKRADGVVFASIDTNGGRIESIGQLNLSTAAISNIISPSPINTVSENNIIGLAFDNTGLMAQTYNYAAPDNQDGRYAYVNTTTGAWSPYVCQNGTSYFIGWDSSLSVYTGLAIHPTTQVIYSSSSLGRLYSLPKDCSSPPTLLGDLKYFDGVNNEWVQAITFGPVQPGNIVPELYRSLF